MDTKEKGEKVPKMRFLNCYDEKMTHSKDPASFHVQCRSERENKGCFPGGRSREG